MLIKMTKMTLVACLVVGAASVALAGDNSVIPGSTHGVNPVHHLALSRKLSLRVWQNGSQAYGIYPARNTSIATIAGVPPMLCPLLEGYPDCHP